MADDALSQFAAITGTTADRAQQYLTLTDGNLEQAIELYYANDGAELESAPSVASIQPSQPPAVPPSSTRPSRSRQGYEDSRGVVHVDSEPESDISDDENAERATTASARRQPHSTSTSLPQTQAASTSSSIQARPVEDDETMARRLQEEFYGATGAGEATDAEGIRAPIARTTETLVGPGAYDLDDEDDMRAAVLEQMRARQQPRPRGSFPLCLC